MAEQLKNTAEDFSLSRQSCAMNAQRQSMFPPTADQFLRLPGLFRDASQARMEHFLRLGVGSCSEAIGDITMLGWVLTFLLVAIIAAVLGFGGIAGFAVEIAKIIFFVAIILLVISVVMALIRGRSPTAL
jgi:uncharacterized membrane protein YtjA (UPF0391 family)